MKELEQLCECAQKSVLELFSKDPHDIGDTASLPADGGVCLIYEEEEVIYVGKAGNLRRRIKEHLSGEKADTVSAFRRSLHQRNGTPFGLEMREWVLTRCRLAYLSVSDADMRALVETLAIAWRRTAALLNK